MTRRGRSKRTIRLARLCLQMAVIIGALVPVGAGLAGIVMGAGMIDGGAVPVSLDSHFRYLSGLLLGIGIGFLSTVPRIEIHGMRFRMLAAIVFIGGLGRLYGLMTVGAPDSGMLFGLGMELVVTPLLAVAQYYVARAMRL